MTKEYALHLLNQLMIGASVDAKPIIPQYELAQALDLAIKALEQQSTGTKTYLKRREDNYVEYNVEWFLKNWELELEILSGGKIKPTDAVSREAINTLIDELARAISDERIGISRGRSTATIMRDILHLPSVTPQRPKGEWIVEQGDRETGYDGCIMCSECSAEGFQEWEYCPNCGAEMGGVE